MHTKKRLVTSDSRLRAEQRRLHAIQLRIANGEIASVSNDTKWEKTLENSEYLATVDCPAESPETHEHAIRRVTPFVASAAQQAVAADGRASS
jgi:hypothetical protein